MGDNSLHLLPYFHGLLPREDLIQLLKISGDFVIRSTEPRAGQQRQFVLSVMIDEKLGGDGIKHLIFSPGEPGTGKYLLGTMNDTAPKIVEYYLQTRIPITHLNEFPVVIKNPIGRQKWELLHEDIQVEQKLGAGAFGEVCMGKLKLANGTQTNVAIKVAKLETLSKVQIKEIMAEARIMRTFEHPHVVKFYGVAAGKEPLMIVMELVDKGALDDYLKKSPVQVSPAKKMELCTQAAWGMEYLHHTLNPPIMHRDIAARNCLYGNEKVKISDFGLAKTGVFFQVTQMTKAPIRWLAPETLKDIIYTPKTDVFSYGVLCWEIFTDAKTEPYAGMTAAEFVPKVKEGYRLDFPEFTPPDFSQLVKTKIWTDNPAERYSMAEVAHGLEKITNLQRPAYSGSDNVHQPKQPHLGSDNQPHGSERQQRGSDKQLRGSDKQLHGSDKQGSDKQPYGSDKQQHGIDKQQQHQDSKKKSGRPNVRKSNDYFSVSAESSHAVHRTQSRRQKNKVKPARKSSNRSHKKA